MIKSEDIISLFDCELLNSLEFFVLCRQGW